MPLVSAIVLAGGKGERFGSSTAKQFMKANGRPLIDYTLDVIEPLVDEIIVVSSEPYKHYRHAPAGATRSESVRNGLKLVSNMLVVVHEAVRPYLTSAVLKEVIRHLQDGRPVVSTAVPVVDGFLEDTGAGPIPKSKEGKYLGQTPEGFQTRILRTAFSLTEQPYRDEVMLCYEQLGIVPTVVEGVFVNSKITFALDLDHAEGILKYGQPPIKTFPAPRPTLILGGTGGIGSKCGDYMPWAERWGSQDLDLSEPFDLILDPWSAIVYAAGSARGDEMEVNFFSCVRIIELAEEQNWKGNIVFLSSSAATHGRKDFPMYSASKAALNSYIEARHEELAEEGIFINAIAPGQVDTQFARELHPNPSNPTEPRLNPSFVAEVTTRYTDTTEHGHIIYLRPGLHK